MKKLLYIFGFLLFAGGVAAQEVKITNSGGGGVDTLYRVANTGMLDNVGVASKWQIGRVVSTDGYYVAGDGGGANYILESGIGNDTSSFTVPGIGRARLLANADGGINFRQLGAKPTDNLSDLSYIKLGIRLFNYLYDESKATYIINGAIQVKDSLTIKLGASTVIKLVTAQDNLLQTPGAHVSVAKISNVRIIGGIWDYGTGPHSGGDNATDDYAFLFNNVENLVLENLKVINAPKYCIDIGNFKNVRTENIQFSGLSDGLHLEGPGQQIRINQISGSTGDDFIGITGRNFAANAYSYGDIKDIVISNLHPDTCQGHVVAMYGGNLGSVNSLFEISDVFIDNVTGWVNNPVVAIPNAGSGFTPSNPNAAHGGIYRNISINNISARSDIGSVLVINGDTIDNVTLSNCFVERPNSQPIDIAKGYITNLVIDKLFHSASNGLGYRSINLQSAANVRSMTVSNSYFMVNANTPYINWTQSTSGGRLTLDKCMFVGLATLQGKIAISSDSLEIKATNLSFTNSYTSFEMNGRGENLFLENVTFSGVTHCVATTGTGTSTIWPVSYKFDGSVVNAFRNLGSGSLTLADANKSQNDFIMTSSAYAISNAYPIGQIFWLKNTHPSAAIPVTTTGETINGAASISLSAGVGVRLKKTSTTEWVTNTLPTVSSGSKWTDIGANIYRLSDIGVNTTTIDADAAIEVRGGYVYTNDENSGIIIDAAGSKRFGFVKQPTILPEFRYAANLSFIYCPSGNVIDRTGASEAMRVTSVAVQSFKPTSIFNSLFNQSGSRTGIATKIGGWDASDKATDVVRGGGLDFTAGTLSALDISPTNEGAQTVGAGGANSSTIASNTAGSTAVTIAGGPGISVTESVNQITIAGTSTGGEYTPTLVSSDTILNNYPAVYTIIGDVVTVTGIARIGHAGTSLISSLTISLPPGGARNFTAQFGELRGQADVNQSDALSTGLPRLSCLLSCDFANDLAFISYEPIGTGGVGRRNYINYTFTYKLLL